MIKKSLCLLLTFATIISILLCPTTVFAASSDVYVHATGSDSNNGTKNAPVATIGKAIELANSAGYTTGDTVHIYVRGQQVNMGDMPAYNFNLVIEGEKITTPSDTPYTKIIGASAIPLANNENGLTTYKKVLIVLTDSWKNFNAHNSNIIFEDTTSFWGASSSIVFGSSNDNGAAKVISHPQTLEFHGTTPEYICLSNFNWSARTYEEDVKLVLDTPNSSTSIQFNSYYLGNPNGTTIFKNDIILDIQAIGSLSFSHFLDTTFEGNLYITNSSQIEISQCAGYSDLPNNTWVIENESANKNCITPTGNKSGEFKINLDLSYVNATVKNSSGAEIPIGKNGIVNLSTPGIYTINTDCKKHYFADYKNNNDATCSKNATETASCSNCTVTDTREIPSSTLPHKYSDDLDTTCNICNTPRKIVGNHLLNNGYYNDWILYVDGKPSTETGLFKCSGEWYYIVNGSWKKITDLIMYSNKWFYIKDGKWNNKTNDLINYNGTYIYIKNGKWANTNTELFKKNGKWFYVKNGKWSNKTNDLVDYKDKKFYIKSGKWASTTTTLLKKNNKWYYIKNGKWNKSKAIVEYSGKKLFVNKGYAQLSFSGKVKIGNKTYKIKKGKVV